MSSHNVGNARIYALIGFIFYVIGLVALISGFFVFVLLYDASRIIDYYRFPVINVVIVVVFFVMLAIWVGLSAWAWSTLKQIEAGKYGNARTNSLILGIIGLLFGLLIGGIFFLLAYSELGNVMFLPPYPQRFCIYCGRAVPPDVKFCPSCGKELLP